MAFLQVEGNFKFREVTHRDYLGSLLGLGLSREKIGDILMVSMVEKGNKVAFKVKVQPRASRNEIAGAVGDAVKLRVTSPPVEGEANEAVIRYFSDLFGVPRKDVSITSGLLSRNKIVEISGISLRQVKETLNLGE